MCSDRLAAILTDAGARLLVTTETVRAEVLAELADPRDGLVRLDTDRAAIAACPADSPVPTAGPGDLAYVIFTSGSTGGASLG